MKSRICNLLLVSRSLTKNHAAQA